MLATIARPNLRADVTWHPLDDRWYETIANSRSDAGPVVAPLTALGVSVVYRAVNVLANAVASVPLIVYRNLDEEGKERAKDHPAFQLLHKQPNEWMTSFRWRHLLMTHAALWGNHYSEIIGGPRGVSALIPLNPDTTRVVDQLNDGRLVYVTKDADHAERRLLQDNVLHIRGFGVDGKSGIPITKTAKNAIGLALSAERHGSSFMRNGARFSGILTTEDAMKKEVREENEKAWNRSYGGSRNSGHTPLLTGGLKYASISSSNKDSQWLEARNFQVEEMLRYLGVPGVLVGHADKTSTYASAEQFFLSFVVNSVVPWTENIAAEINSHVITQLGGDEFFSEFMLEGLLKGDIKTRYEAYRVAIEAGFTTRNEVRIKESMNKGPAPLDEFLQPLNFAEAGSEPAAQTQQSPPPPANDDTNATSAQMVAIANRSVWRLVNKEDRAIFGGGRAKGAAVRYAGDADGWAKWLAGFYDDHAQTVAADLGIALADADKYARDQVAIYTELASVPEDHDHQSRVALLNFIPGMENRE